MRWKESGGEGGVACVSERRSARATATTTKKEPVDIVKEAIDVSEAAVGGQVHTSGQAHTAAADLLIETVIIFRSHKKGARGSGIASYINYETYFWERNSDGVAFHQAVVAWPARLYPGRHANFWQSCV